MKRNLKDRVVSAVLALTMVASLLPAGLVTPAQAVLTTSDTGHNVGAVTGSSGAFSADMYYAAGGQMGSHIFVLIPDVSVQGKEAVPSAQAGGANMSGNFPAISGLTSALAAIGAVSPEKYFQQTGGSGTYDSNKMANFNGNMALTFDQALADLEAGGYVDASGNSFVSSGASKSTKIPMIAIYWSGTGPYLAWSTTEWDGSELTLTKQDDIEYQLTAATASAGTLSLPVDIKAEGGSGVLTGIYLEIKNGSGADVSSSFSATLSNDAGDVTPVSSPTTSTPANLSDGTYSLKLENLDQIRSVDGPFTGKIVLNYQTAAGTKKTETISVNITPQDNTATAMSVATVEITVVQGTTNIVSTTGGDFSFTWARTGRTPNFVTNPNVIQAVVQGTNQGEGSYTQVTAPVTADTQIATATWTGGASGSHVETVSIDKVNVGLRTDSATENTIKNWPIGDYNDTIAFGYETVNTSNVTAAKETTVNVIIHVIAADAATFRGNGGNWPSDGNATYKSVVIDKDNENSVTPPSDPTHPNGDTFLGWYLSTDSTQTVISSWPQTGVANGTIYLAKWQPQVVNKVTFKAGTDASWTGSVTEKEVNLDTNGYAVSPGEPDNAPTNKLFNGWKLTRTGATIADSAIATTVLQDNDVLTAIWVEQYTITFDPDGGKWNDNTTAVKSFTTDASGDINTSSDANFLVVPGAPALTAAAGAKFLGWYSGNTQVFAPTATQANINNNSGSHYSADQTLTAKWDPLYKITFDANDATSGTLAEASWTQTTGSTESHTMPGKGTLVKTGYYFVGWSEDGTETGKITEGSSYTPTKNITLKAVWLETLALSFDKNEVSVNLTAGTATGGPADLSNQEPGDKTITSATPSLTGHKFKSWNTKADGTGTSYTPDGDNKFVFNLTEDTTLYAVWEALPTITGANLTEGTGYGLTAGSKVKLNTVTLSDNTTKNNGTDGEVSEPGANGHVEVTEWRLTWGNAVDADGTPNGTTVNSWTSGTTADITLPDDATVGQYLWVLLKGDDENVAATPKWVPFAVGANKLTLTVQAAVFEADGTTTAASIPNTITAIGSASLDAKDTQLMTAICGTNDYEFLGWNTTASTSNLMDQTLGYTDTAGWKVSGFNPSTAAAQGSNTATFTAPYPLTAATSVTIYAVFRAKPKANVNIGYIIEDEANFTLPSSVSKLVLTPSTTSSLLSEGTLTIHTDGVNSDSHKFKGWVVTTTALSAGTIASANYSIFTTDQTAATDSDWSMTLSGTTTGIGGGSTGTFKAQKELPTTGTTNYYIYAVYEQLPAHDFEVKNTDGNIASVTVKVKRGSTTTDITAGSNGFGTYTGKVQEGDVVIITSTPKTNYTANSFDITTATSPTANYTENSKTLDTLMLIIGADTTSFTVDAKAKGTPPQLVLVPTAGSATLKDNGDLENITEPTITATNKGGQTARVTAVEIVASSGDNDYFAANPANGGLGAATSTNTVDVASGDNNTATIPHNSSLASGNSWTQKTYSVDVKATYLDDDGDSHDVTTTVNFVVSRTTTYTGKVTVQLDDTADSGYTVTLKQGSTTISAFSTSSNVSTFNNLTKGTSYSIEVSKGGITYHIAEALTDANKDVTVDLYTVTVKGAANSSATNSAIASVGNAHDKSFTLGINALAATVATGDPAASQAVKDDTITTATATKIVPKGASVTVTEADTALNTGYAFSKWTSDDTGSTSVSADQNYTFTVTGTTTLYANMAASGGGVALNYDLNYQYAVDYLKADGNRANEAAASVGLPATQVGIAGTDFVVSSVKPKLPGYVFRGWALTADPNTGNAVPDPDTSGLIKYTGSETIFNMTTNTTLYAIWEEATISADNVTDDTDWVYGTYDIRTPAFNAKSLAITDDASSAVTLRYAVAGCSLTTTDGTHNVDRKMLPGGLALDSSSGEVYGRPYMVGASQAATIQITLAQDFHVDANRIHADVTYTATVGKATPTIKSVTVSGAVPGKNINTANYTIVVEGPRFISGDGTNGDSRNSPGNDVWDLTYTDTLVYTSGDPGTAAHQQTSGVASLASGDGLTATAAGGVFDDASTSVTVKVAVQPHGTGVTYSGGTANNNSSDFDGYQPSAGWSGNTYTSGQGNMQNTVWEDPDAKTVQVTTDGSTHTIATDIDAWIYAFSDNSPARAGYTVDATGTNGYVTNAGTSGALDVVAAKQFVLKNTGNVAIPAGKLSFSFGNGASSAFAMVPGTTTTGWGKIVNDGLTADDGAAGGTDELPFQVAVKAGKTATPGLYTDTLTITNTGDSGVLSTTTIRLTFVVTDPLTYDARITVNYQGVEDTAKLLNQKLSVLAVKDSGVNITLKPIGNSSASDVVLTSTTEDNASNNTSPAVDRTQPWWDDSTNNYVVPLVTGTTYKVWAATTKGGEFDTGLTITGSSNTATVEFFQVAVDADHYNNGSDAHTAITWASKTPNSIADNGAGWYVSGDTAALAAYTSGTIGSGDSAKEYVFDEWYAKAPTDSDDTAAGTNNTVTVTAPKTYYAHYKEADATKVTVTYKNNIPATATVGTTTAFPTTPQTEDKAPPAAQKYITLSSTKPTRTGYKFLGWAQSGDVELNTNSDTADHNEMVLSSGKTEADLLPVGDNSHLLNTTDHTLYAIWEKGKITTPDGTPVEPTDSGDKWKIDLPDGTYGTDYSYTLPALTTSDGTVVDGATVTYTSTDLAAIGLTLNATTGEITGKPFKVADGQSIDITATHAVWNGENGYDLVSITKTVTINVKPYQLQMTNAQVRTDDVVEDGAAIDSVKYTATILKAPIYVGGTGVWEWWSVDEAATTANATDHGALAIDTDKTPTTTQFADGVVTSVALKFNPDASGNAGKKDANNSNFNVIYKAAEGTASAAPRGKTFTMEVQEDNRSDWTAAPAVNKGANITMWGDTIDMDTGAPATGSTAADKLTHQGKFLAKMGYTVSGTDNDGSTAAGTPDNISGQQFVLTNTGNQEIAAGTLTYKFTSTGTDTGDHFTITEGTLQRASGLAASGSASGYSGTFIITPKAGAAPGSYTDTLIIDNGNFTVSVTVTLEVTAGMVPVDITTNFFDWGTNGAKTAHTITSADTVSVVLINSNGTAADNVTLANNSTDLDDYKGSIKYTDTYYLEVNGYVVPGVVISKDKTAHTVELLQVTAVTDPAINAGAPTSAAPTVAGVASTGATAMPKSAAGGTYVVNGQSATVTAQAGTDTYNYKEIDKFTDDSSKSMVTAALSYSTGPVTAVSKYAALYTQGLKLTYRPNANDVKWVGTGTATGTPVDNTNGVVEAHALNDTVTVKAPGVVTDTVTVSGNPVTATGWTRANYDFVGWSTTEKTAGQWDHSNAGDYAPGDTITLTGDVTLYAVWRDASALTLDGRTFPLAYMEALPTSGGANNDIRASGGNSTSYTYTATTDVDSAGNQAALGGTGHNEVFDKVTFTPNNTSNNFSYTGRVTLDPTDAGKTVTSEVTVTDASSDTATADFVFALSRANTQVTTGWTDKTYTGVSGEPKAGDIFNFTQLDGDPVIEPLKADGSVNPDFDLDGKTDLTEKTVEGSRDEATSTKNENVDGETIQTGGTWTVKYIDGHVPTGSEINEKGEVLFQPGEHEYTLEFTPTNSGFKPCETTVTLTFEKKINFVRPSIYYPEDTKTPKDLTTNPNEIKVVKGANPTAASGVDSNGDVHATGASPAVTTSDVKVTSVSWPDGQTNSAFDFKKDITVLVTVEAQGDWSFDVENITGQFSDLNVDPSSTDDSASGDNVAAEVVSCTDKTLVLSYTWLAETKNATNIRVQVTAPVKNSTPDTNTYATGTPANSFTPTVVMWVKGTTDDGTATGKVVVSSTAFANMTAMGSTDTFEAGESYVVIVKADANDGYAFAQPGDTTITDPGKKLAALDGTSDYARINNVEAKVLKVATDDDTGRDVVWLAVEFTVKDSDITGLVTATGPLDYYVLTTTDPAASSNDWHFSGDATGHKSSYGFVLSKSAFTIEAVNTDKNKVKVNPNDFILFVDKDGSGTYTSGDVLMDTNTSGSGDPNYSGAYSFNYDNGAVSGERLHSLDGGQLYAVYAPGGVANTEAGMTRLIGTLNVKPLKAVDIDAVAKSSTAGWTIDADNKFQITAASTTVYFNSADGGLANQVATVSYAPRGTTYGLTDALSATESAEGGSYRPSYYYMLDDNRDGSIDATAKSVDDDGNGTDDRSNVTDVELQNNVSFTSADKGKGIYICYTDVNGYLVTKKVGTVGANFEVHVDDSNGHDPEYKDTLTGEPWVPTYDPDHPENKKDPDDYEFQWEVFEPDDPADPDPATGSGKWTKIPGGKNPDYVPDKDDVGEYIRVVITDPGDPDDPNDDVSVESGPILISPRSLNFDVASVNKVYDGDQYNDDHAYTSSDFRPTEVEQVYDNASGTFVDTASFGGPVPGDTIVISPYDDGVDEADSQSEAEWNKKTTSGHYAGRPTYQDATPADSAEVNSVITWPVVRNDDATADAGKTHAIGVTSGYSLDGTATNTAGKLVYRLVDQNKLTPRGVIMAGGGSVTHVNVDFKLVPSIGSDVPNYPDADDKANGGSAVTDMRETRPGEVTDAQDEIHTAAGQDGYYGEEYIAMWYKTPADNDTTGHTGENFDVNNLPTGNDVINSGNTAGRRPAGNTFDGDSVTVLVKVTPRKGYKYEMLKSDDSNAATATKFHFHFGKDVTVDLPVSTTGKGPKGVMEVEESVGESGNVTAKVYYMWYTFEGGSMVLPPFDTGSDPLPNSLTADLFRYYAQTAGHTAVNTADNTNIPGGKEYVPFQFMLDDYLKTDSNTVTGFKNAIGGANSGAGTVLKRGDGSTVTLTADNYGTTWRLVAGDQPDNATLALDNGSAGRTFKDTVNLKGTHGTTQGNTDDRVSDNANTGDSVSYDGKYIYIQVTYAGGQTQIYPTPLKVNGAFTPLTVKELTAEEITAAGTLKLAYKQGEKFDASGVTAASVSFNKDAWNVTYAGAARADAATGYDDDVNDTGSATFPAADTDNKVDLEGKVYYFQYWDDTNSKYVNLQYDAASGNTGSTEMTEAMGGKLVYICYTDVNNHVVRKLLGALAVGEATSTAAIYIRNTDDKDSDTRYGDTLKAEVVGNIGNVTLHWERWVWKDGIADSDRTDANVGDTTKGGWTNITGATNARYKTQKADVGTHVRAVLDTDTVDGVQVNVGVASGNTATENILKVGKKELKLSFTASDKVWDGDADVDTVTINDPLTILAPQTGDTISVLDTSKDPKGKYQNNNADETQVGTWNVELLNKVGSDFSVSDLTGADSSGTAFTNVGDYYELEIVPTTASITKLVLDWTDFEFTGKIKRYDGTDTVYKVDNTDLVKENTDPSLTGQVAYDKTNGVDKDGGLWSIKTGEKIDAALRSILEAKMKAINVAYTSPDSQEQRSAVPVTDNAQGHSVITLEMKLDNGADAANITMPQGSYYIKNSAINPKQVSVGANEGMLNAVTYNSGVKQVTVTGYVNGGQVPPYAASNSTDTVEKRVDRDKNDSTAVTFQVQGAVEGTTVTFIGVRENYSDGIYWTNDNYKLVWDDSTATTGTEKDGTPYSIEVVTPPTVTYGDHLSAAKLTVKLQYRDADDNVQSPETAKEYTFAELANLGFKAIVQHDTNSNVGDWEYGIASDPNALAGWDNDDSHTPASTVVRFYYDNDLTGTSDLAAQFADTTAVGNDSGKYLGTTNITVNPYKLTIQPTWGLGGKYYDKNNKVLGEIKDAAGGISDADVTVGSGTAGMTFIYTIIQFSDTVVVDGGYTAAFDSVNVGTGIPITVSGSLTGAHAKRYTAKFEKAEGNIVKRPVTLELPRPQTLQTDSSPVKVPMREEFGYGSSAIKSGDIIDGDTIDVSVNAVYLKPAEWPNNETGSKWNEDDNNFDEARNLGTTFTDNVKWTNELFSGDAANYDITIDIPGGDVVSTASDIAVEKLYIDYFDHTQATGPKKDGTPANDYSSGIQATVADHVDGDAATTQWYTGAAKPAADTTAAFDTAIAGKTVMLFTGDTDAGDPAHTAPDKYAYDSYYLVQSIFTVKAGFVLSDDTVVRVEDQLDLVANGTPQSTANASGLVAARATYNNGDGTITVQAIYKTSGPEQPDADATFSINYVTPVAEAAVANHKDDYTNKTQANVDGHAQNNANTTQWYPTTAGDFDPSGKTAMLFTGDTDAGDSTHTGPDTYAYDTHYLVQSVFTPKTGSEGAKYDLSKVSVVKVDGMNVLVGASEAAAVEAVNGSNTTGLLSAKAFLDGENIVVRAIYKTAATTQPTEIGAEGDIFVTYPYPVTGALVNKWKDPDFWGNTNYVNIVTNGADKSANGTKGYKVTGAGDWTSTANQLDTYSGTETFANEQWYRVESVITPKNTPAPGYKFADDAKVQINGVTVTVGGEAKTVTATDGTILAYVKAEWVDPAAKTAIRAMLISKTDPDHDIVKVINTTFIPYPNAALPAILDSVKQPSPTYAEFWNGADATGNVTVSGIRWKDNTANAGMVPGDVFIYDHEYQVEFTLKPDAQHNFRANAAEDEWVNFLIDGLGWIQGAGNAQNASGSIQVETTKVNDNEYTVKVLFKNIGDAKNYMAVYGWAEKPETNKPVDVDDITVDPDQPYEIQTISGTENKHWEHWNKTANTWETVTSGSFQPGEFYRAVLTVELTDPNYEFVEDVTKGFINGSSTTKLDTLPMNSKDDSEIIVYNKNGAKVETITLAQVFEVEKAKVMVHVGSAVPKAGQTGNDLDKDVDIHARFKAADSLIYTLSDGKLVDGTTNALGKWYTRDPDPANPGEFLYTPMGNREFGAGGTYYLAADVELVNINASYTLYDVEGGYEWYDNDNVEPKRIASGFIGEKTLDSNGEVTACRVYFSYTIPDPADRNVYVIPGYAQQPQRGSGNTLSNITTSADFDVVPDTAFWTKEKDGTSTRVEIGSPVENDTVYRAHITVIPKEHVIIPKVDGKVPDSYYFFNNHDTSDLKFVEHIDNGDGTYTLVYEFTDTSHDSGGGGGNTVTVENPVVYYHLRDQGVTDDPTAEKVKRNSSPKNVPTVKAMTGLKFLGWSEVDPNTLPTGTLPTLVDPTTFKITADKWFYAVYEQGTEVDHNHYVIGFPNGTFAPDAKITRAEVATIIARSCLKGFVEGANYGNPGNYSDVSEHWAFSAISFCSREGVFSGYEDGTFRPDRYITRQELAAVVARLAGVQTNAGLPFSDQGEIASWALNGVYTNYVNGWVNGYEDNTFRPERDISRAETVKIFNGYLGRGIDAKGLEGLKEYIHQGVASHNTENGHDEYMTWPDVPKTHWAYYEIIEAANDHNYHWQDEKKTPPEDWDEVYIDEKWRYNDNLDDGAEKRDENMALQKTFTVTYLVSSNGQTYDAITETVERFASPKPENMPVAVPNPGYRFAGWSSTDPSTGTITLVDPTASGVTSDKWFYAVFEEDKPYTLPVYTVTYVIGEKGSYSGATVERVEMFQAPSVSGLPQPTVQDGWYLAGWSETDPASGSYTIVDPTANYVTGDKTFYAVYAQVVVNALPVYTVTYVIGSHGTYGGATTERVEMFQAPSVAGLPQPTANAGYRFIGWSETDPQSGSYTIVDPTANYVTGDKTFYAVFQAV